MIIIEAEELSNLFYSIVKPSCKADNFNDPIKFVEFQK